MNNYKINNINDKLKLPFELFSIDVIKSRLEELKKEDNPISNFYELDKATKKKIRENGYQDNARFFAYIKFLNVMMQEKLKEIRDLLTEVKYPGTSKNIVELDMVQNIRIEGEKVLFRLVFQKAGDPFVGSVKKKAEALIKEKTSYTEVEIENLFVQDLERPLSLEKVKNIIAVSSGKGGVGKSTVAANLAVALAAEGYKVGLVDADIFGPSIPKMFGCEEAQPYMEQIDGKDFIVPVEKYGVKLLSIGFFVDPASATVWRGPMASNALKQMVEQGFWDELDYMLIDLPPGTSDIHLTLVQTVALTGAIVVSTPQQVALADAIKGINMFESPGIQVPVLGLVENMAWFTPAELPDHKYYIFGREGAKQLAEQRGLRLLGEIPVVQSICDGGDAGKPVALNADSITGTAFRQLADEVVKAVEENHDPAKRVRVTRQ